MPSRQNTVILQKNVRRIRTICEFAEHFLEFIFPTAGRGEPLPYGANRAKCLFCNTPFLIHIHRKEAAGTAGMKEEHLVLRTEGALLCHGKKPRKGLSRIDRVQEDPFLRCHQ